MRFVGFLAVLFLAKTAIAAVGPLGSVDVFLSSRCPCSKSHEPVLRRLAAAYPQFAFRGWYQATETEAAQHFQRSALGFPVAVDEDGARAKSFEALRSPQVFVSDASGRLRYQGAVDDSHVAEASNEPLLERALASLVAGRDPDPARTRPLGCVLPLP